MFSFAPTMTDENQTASIQPKYYSVEFPLKSIQPVYQFKLRPSAQNSFFLLVKNGSDIVSQLKLGHIVPMKYYSEDSMHTIEVHKTQIMEIVKETHGPFRGHYRIELGIISDKSNSPDSETNDNQEMKK